MTSQRRLRRIAKSFTNSSFWIFAKLNFPAHENLIIFVPKNLFFVFKFFNKMWHHDVSTNYKIWSFRPMSTRIPSPTPHPWGKLSNCGHPKIKKLKLLWPQLLTTLLALWDLTHMWTRLLHWKKIPTCFSGRLNPLVNWWNDLKGPSLNPCPLEMWYLVYQSKATSHS